MKILTEHNRAYDLDVLPSEIDDVRYCVLDTTEPDNIDYYWLPLVFLESFQSPVICLKIGEYQIQAPMDWSILICDEDYTSVEVIPLASLNNRGFRAVMINPLRSMSAQSEEISITNVYTEIKWHFPKLKNGHVMAMPLTNGPDPLCVFLVKDGNKIKEMQIGDLF